MAFTYAGPSVGATLVVGAFNEALAVAQDRLTKTDDLTNDAIASIVNAPSIQEVDIAAALNIPPPPIIEGLSSSEMTDLYNSTADEIKALLEDGLTDFFTTYFPLGAEMAQAQAWLLRALSGGSGLPAHIEEQIWQRDRARILREAYRASDDAMAMWAARGYALPPGALVGTVNKIMTKANDEIIQSSRDRAVEAARLEIENAKFAVDQALKLRVAAIQSASDYLRTLVLGPELGAKLATTIVTSKTEMAKAVTAAYSAEISALELPTKIAISDAQLDVEVRKANLAAATETIAARTRSIEAAAQHAATQASAALHGLSAQAGFSSTERA